MMQKHFPHDVESETLHEKDLSTVDAVANAGSPLQISLCQDILTF